MPRDLPLGNGSLLLNFDGTYRIRDLYWRHVGLENHTDWHVCRFGVWADERFVWLDDPRWSRRLQYSHETLVIQVDLSHKEISNLLRTWKDAENGLLSGNPIAQRSVDSTVAVHLTVPARGAQRAYYWFAVG